MSSAKWSRAACLLANDTNAAVIYVEWSFGWGMCTLAIDTASNALQKEGAIPRDRLKPMIGAVSAKQGKLLRAEPIAQQMIEDRARLRGRSPTWRTSGGRGSRPTRTVPGGPTPRVSDAWLDPTNQDPNELRTLLDQPAGGHLYARPVSTAVNNVRNNGPQLLDELTP